MVGDLYLYYMGLFEKFLEGNSYLRELLDTYLELRLHLQEEGFSQEELKSVTQPTYKMIRLGEKFIEKKIKKETFENKKGKTQREIDR
jgi:hypothetical protein